MGMKFYPTTAIKALGGIMATSITTDPGLPLLRLLQLVSPALPIGAFAYSQGLEWAIEGGWVKDEADLESWLEDLLRGSLIHVDLPALARLYQACTRGDAHALVRWSSWLLACRETAELRAEERQRGRALAALLADLGVPGAKRWRSLLESSQIASFALAAQADGIALRDALLGYAWSWLEGQVLAGVKLVPLGQTAGQRVQRHLGRRLPSAVQTALTLADDELGATTPALAIASSRHETQYTRLFRS
jgi:urease accessory protein